MSTKKEVGQRLQNIRKEIGLSQKDFALKLGYETYAPIKDIEAGVTNLKPVIAKAIEFEFDVSQQWLLHGEGEKYRAISEGYEEYRDKVMESIEIVEKVFSENNFELEIKKKAELIALVLDAKLKNSVKKEAIRQLIVNLVKLAE